jgi:hypothetical protein
MTKKYAIGFLSASSAYLEGNLKKLSWIPDAEEIWDLEKFRNDPRPKILMVPCFNPGGELPTRGDYSWVDLIIADTDEFLNSSPGNTILEQTQKAFNNQNIIFITGGLVPEMINSDRIYHPMIYWIRHMFNSNEYTPSPLPAQKPYLFDALLGQIKEHRLFVFYKLIEDNLLDKSLVSLWRHYRHGRADLTKAEVEKNLYDNYSTAPICGDLLKKHGLTTFYRSPGLDELEFSDIPYPVDDPINYTSSQATTRFCKTRPTVLKSMSMDMPVNIYDASWYSIVAETRHESDNLFITEKLGKPLWGKRVFVLFGARGCLQYLRSQGFQTFNDIIDESYDLEIDDCKRFAMAWEQVKLLSTLDPIDVYQRANAALENNYNLMPTLDNEHLKVRDFIAQWLPR